MEKRFILFLVLTFAIIFGWSYFFAPKPNEVKKTAQSQTSQPQTQKIETQPATPAPNVPNTQAGTPVPSEAAAEPAVKVDSRQIKLTTPSWNAVLSNTGGVITDWTMTALASGKAIDAPTGVNLISPKLSKTIGAPFRFYIPSDKKLQDELNTANYQVLDIPEGNNNITLDNNSEKSISFVYKRGDIEVTKKLTFKGADVPSSTGFDFKFSASVKRNNNPVDAYVVIGPNFGDQNVKEEASTYRHAPQMTYATAGTVEREAADVMKNNPVMPVATPVTWAAVDDNYFAMAIVPTQPVPAVRFLDKTYLSMAVALNQSPSFNVYAGPKDLNLLSEANDSFGLKTNGDSLDRIVSYGWLNWFSFALKPIAQFMLNSLRVINKFTHNYGWSIVILTILLNMLFFPLRWKSSVTMKKAAKMQPKMKDLQEKMKKLDKNDPKMQELQKEQIALMKQGNPLLGCLPLLLQMPFFMAVFVILSVSIEVRHAPFFGWLQDLSSPDPYYILPIIMCVTMVAQQALTPSPTVDPVQKKIGYLMPLMFGFFLKSAPAGLVLYWMVGNLVGVVQQFIINRLNPSDPSATADSGQGQPDDKFKKKGKKKIMTAPAN